MTEPLFCSRCGAVVDVPDEGVPWCRMCGAVQIRRREAVVEAAEKIVRVARILRDADWPGYRDDARDAPPMPSELSNDDEFLSGSVGWYRLDGHTPVRMRTRAEHYAEWDRRERGVLNGDDPYRVARTELDSERCVSTVFLGLDHNWWPDAAPLLFETMVFPECDVCERCSTWEQAVAQHDQVVAHERELPIRHA